MILFIKIELLILGLAVKAIDLNPSLPGSACAVIKYAHANDMVARVFTLFHWWGDN